MPDTLVALLCIGESCSLKDRNVSIRCMSFRDSVNVFVFLADRAQGDSVVVFVMQFSDESFNEPSRGRDF